MGAMKRKEWNSNPAVVVAVAPSEFGLATKFVALRAGFLVSGFTFLLRLLLFLKALNY